MATANKPGVDTGVKTKTVTDSGSRSANQPSEDPQIRKMHETKNDDEELGRDHDTGIEQGGSRHRTQ